MIHSIEQDVTLPVPLTLKGHQIAQLFYEQHSDPKKAKQVYLNTLAVEAVHSYLSWLGIATDLEAGDSWNPISQTLADVADLVIPTQGKLECRPVLPGATVCYVAPEVWAGRIGYVAVRLDAELQSATLLGFVPHVETEILPLSQLQPLAVLLDHLNPQEKLQDPTWVGLGQWLQGQVTSGWQTLAELFGPQPSLSFRSTEPDQGSSVGLTTCGKLLELPAAQQPAQQVVLVIGLMPSDPAQMDIWVKLCPIVPCPYLPENLEIRVLDQQGVAVMQAQARQTEMLQLKFQATVGERFSLEIGLDQIHLIETFVV